MAKSGDVHEDACGCVRDARTDEYIDVCRAHAGLKQQAPYAELMRDAREVLYRG